MGDRGSLLPPEPMPHVYGQKPGAWGFPRVDGRCPSCHSASLFLAVGGHVTCSVIACENPTAVDDWLHEVRV